MKEPVKFKFSVPMTKEDYEKAIDAPFESEEEYLCRIKYNRLITN